MTTSGNEWQRVVQRVTTNDNEWYNETQRVVQQVTTSESEWERVSTNDNEWQQMTMCESEWQQVVQQIKTAQFTSKNGWLPFFL